MSKQSGKNGKVVINTAQTHVAAPEVATLNTGPETVGGVAYAAYRVATLAHTLVFPDSPQTPLSITPAVAGGSAIPTDLSYIVDYDQGKIIFNQVLTSGNTVTVDYYYAGTLVELVEMTDWSFSLETKDVDVTCFGDEFEHSLPTQKSWAGSFGGHVNLTAWNATMGATDSAQENVASQVVFIKMYLNRSSVSATNPYFAGPCVITKYDMKASHAGKIEISGTFKGVGGLAKAIA